VSEVVAVTLIGSAPFAVVLALLAWADRRERRRREVLTRQIALTDCVHERLGAVAAPVVRHRRGVWYVAIAVPFERPAVIEALVAIVLEAFPAHDRRSLEIVLTHRPETPPARAAGGRGVKQESLSWT
jgi:hypothetical protein